MPVSLACTVSEMTYIVSGGTINSTHSLACMVPLHLSATYAFLLSLNVIVIGIWNALSDSVVSASSVDSFRQQRNTVLSFSSDSPYVVGTSVDLVALLI